MDNKTIFKRVTLKEIAEQLNLSPSTVSAILNNKPNCFASKRTKRKVVETAIKLGYRPNFVARSLRKQKTYTIGFIAPLLTTGITLSDIEILETLCWEKGYQLLIGYSKINPEREEKILEEFYYRRVDGIILIPTGLKSENKFLKNLVEVEFPIVTITKAEGVDISFVSTDYQRGGYIATEYLIKTGHKRIGFFGSSVDFYSIRERFYGYKKALEVNGIKFKEDRIFIVQESKDFDIIYRVGKKIIKQGLDGIFAGNDTLALILIKVAMDNGLKIPDDVSIVGFDDSEIAKFSPVALTTVRQPVEKITRSVFDILLNMIEGKRKGRRKIMFEPELIIRDSVKKRIYIKERKRGGEKNVRSTQSV